MPVFISKVKKENSIQRKNEHGDICFLINFKLICKISFEIISFFVSVVTLCDIFILDLNNFLAFKNKLRAFFSLFIVFFY